MLGRGGFGGRGGRGGGMAGGFGSDQGGGLGGGSTDFTSPPQKLIGAAVKGIASGIGLISERQKKAKSDKSIREEDHAAFSVEQPSEVLAMEWALDNAQESISDGQDSTSDDRTSDQVIDSFLAVNMAPPTHPNQGSLQRLQFPVLLPQRRPKDRTRGFIRAYAPALEACGIDQTQWLSFLDTFEKSSQASSWIMALNLATLATMALPSLTAFAVSAAVQAATAIASEAQTRYKTNHFLDRINRNYFQPRGLFCLVLTWNPESEDVHQAYDLTNHVAKAVDSRNKFRGSSGQSYGESMLMEVAPLVFPGLDQLHDEGGLHADGKRQKLKKEKAFVADYFDRRATAKYAAKNPESVLATSVPTPQFKSRYADPSHAASSGDLIALITGGRLTNPGLGGAVSSVAGQHHDGENKGAPSTQAMGSGNLDRGKSMNLKRLLGKNVLYLLVVNMPSGEELAAARLEL